MPDATRHVAVRCRVCGEQLSLSGQDTSAATILAFVAAHEHDDGDQIELTISD